MKFYFDLNRFYLIASPIQHLGQLCLNL